VSSTAPPITAITRTLSEIGKNSASLVPESKDRRHLAQSCESLQRRDGRSSDRTRERRAASSSFHLWRTGAEARATDFAKAEGKSHR
jgi:hypothetical protein